jgi:hypothetical protein
VAPGPGRNSEIFHLQAAASQKVDHVTVAKVELHRLIIWPFQPMHLEVRPQQPVARSVVALPRFHEMLVPGGALWDYRFTSLV